MATQEELEILAKKLLIEGVNNEDIIAQMMLLDLEEGEQSLTDGKKSPAKEAKIILNLIKKENPLDDEYSQYEKFFDKYLPGAKLDIISKEFLRFNGQFWTPVKNQLDSLKSFAIGHGLKHTKVPFHFARYVDNQRLRTLIDLPCWDGSDRIEELRVFMKFKNEDFSVFEDAFKEWLANVWRRLLEPNAQNRCIILKGLQGMGKDRLVQNLLSGFGPYYSKFSSNRDERECWSQVTSKLVLHIEEFDQTGQLSVPFLKDLISRGEVTYRSPYAITAEPRRCYGSFISTVNIDAILRDETGNRRFAVFELESIDWDYPKDWADQILAQSYALYQANYRAQKETWQSVTQNNEKFEMVDMAPELLDMWDHRIAAMCGPNGPKPGVTELTFNEVSAVINDLCKVSGYKPRSICGLLKSNGRSRKGRGASKYWSNMIKIPANGDLSATTNVVEFNKNSPVG